jgi:uncharacterized protein YbbK (DUF523 family)
MSKILISACLCGENCKYNSGNNYNECAKKLVDSNKAIMVCPEVDGGLPTPRVPAEIQNGAVINKDLIDVTKEYEKGAKAALKTALENKVELAILQARSPSCGSSKIYDGTFSGTLIDGQGVTTKLLRENGIKVITIDQYTSESK